MLSIPTNISVLGFGNSISFDIPDGVEVPASDYVGITIHNAITTIATTLLGVTLIGFTY